MIDAGTAAADEVLAAYDISGASLPVVIAQDDAVGDGAMAVALAHRRLDELEREPSASAT